MRLRHTRVARMAQGTKRAQNAMQRLRSAVGQEGEEEQEHLRRRESHGRLLRGLNDCFLAGMDRRRCGIGGVNSIFPNSLYFTIYGADDWGGAFQVWRRAFTWMVLGTYDMGIHEGMYHNRVFIYIFFSCLLFCCWLPEYARLLSSFCFTWKIPLGQFVQLRGVLFNPLS